ncbi:carbon-nitrogen hydrolase [Lentisphaera profundi]|uniref:Carbon-nitrogen hydrolase n=1 Tax=Lentisphaera profundi TaxID=1658616 RepID=A0ABY7W0P8_9BACT|nr:carbon-nitrogen hydrolase [Lentisphaera profundi]WDE98697.1 carbon-nitrogen hydrolase [Lentisphaera profundi]
MPKLALLQSRDYGSPEANKTQHLELIANAVKQGANIICSQELFLSNYFCREQNTDNFQYAQKIDKSLLADYQIIAKEFNCVLALSFFEEALNGVYYNSAVVIDADGSYLGKYRKMHIPQDPYFEEKFYFSPGDLGVPVFETKFGKISVIICWDQWFPESSRLACLAGAEIILVPTAIGWLPDEKTELGRAQQHAWTQVQLGQAVANSCYYAAVNRVGIEDPIEFWGHSFISDFYGQTLAQASDDQEEILFADLDLSKLREHRQIWPFLRDRRIDSYSDLNKRTIES